MEIMFQLFLLKDMMHFYILMKRMLYIHYLCLRLKENNKIKSFIVDICVSLCVWKQLPLVWRCVYYYLLTVAGGRMILFEDRIDAAEQLAKRFWLQWLKQVSGIPFLMQLFYKIECIQNEYVSWIATYWPCCCKSYQKGYKPAYNHTKNHITTQGEILKLDADCEYCKVYFEEQRILNR
jgi:hypothetical protein